MSGAAWERLCTFLNFTFSFTLQTLAVFAVSLELWSLTLNK